MASFLRKLLLVLFILIILFVLYTWLTLSYSYSTGSRAGFLQKFSKRGWVCKTWEGELVTGSMLGNQEKFSFSVRDDELAKMVSSNIGKRVEIEYNQHVGIPTNCFAETEYFVNKIKGAPDIREGILQ
jgi:hypothetical protein